MSITLTCLTDRFSNRADGIKETIWSISCTNPYTTGGELCTAFSGYSNHYFYGGRTLMVDPGCTAAARGRLATGVFVGNYATSTNLTDSTTVRFQMFEGGLGATANAGLWVDNTTANISAHTAIVSIRTA